MKSNLYIDSSLVFTFAVTSVLFMLLSFPSSLHPSATFIGMTVSKHKEETLVIGHHPLTEFHY